LATARHGNKLKVGHLAGNRFAIRVRAGVPENLERARAGLAVLRDRGVPNAYGEQRFGRDGTTADMGRALLRGDAAEVLRLMGGTPRTTDSPRLAAAKQHLQAGEWAAAAAVLPHSEPLVLRAVRAAARRGRPTDGLRALPKRFQNLLLSAVQSEVFNAVLMARADSFDRMLSGDIAYLHKNGACFLVGNDTAEANQRAARFEISPSGPIFGTDTFLGAGEPRRIEDAALVAAGLTAEAFGAVPGLRQKGARRPLRIPLRGAEATTIEGDLVVRFTLPRGAYATVVLEQLFHGPAGHTGQDEGQEPDEGETDERDA
jgi:tRNA pseudouridine13 synthase